MRLDARARAVYRRELLDIRAELDALDADEAARRWNVYSAVVAYLEARLGEFGWVRGF